MSEIASIAVFCGSKEGVNQAFAEGARVFGTLLAERNIRLVYGGGRIGLMGVIADAVLSKGGRVTGVIPDFLMRYEIGHPGVADMEIVGGMHARKARMAELADAFVMLPGGIGTLDEAIEIITWKQLRLHDKPIIVVNQEGYWKRLDDLMTHCVEGGFAHEKVRELYTVVPDIGAILPAIKTAPEADERVLTSHL